MGTITFNETPEAWRVPGSRTEIRARYDRTGVAEWPTKVLLIAQAITGTPGVLNVPVRLFREQEAAARWGNGSIAHAMARAFFKNNGTTEIWMMAQGDATGAVKATGKIALTSSPSASGTLAYNIAGRRVTSVVAAGATLASIATALVAAINLIPLMPIVASTNATNGEVVLTAKHGGTLGNGIDLRANPVIGDATPAGLISTVTAMSGGAGVPDVTVPLTAIAATWFTDIAFAHNDAASLTVIEAELAARYRAGSRKDAHGYVGWRGTVGELAALGAARNSPFVSAIGAKRAGSPTWAWAAALCGKASYHLTEDPARQLRTIVLEDIVGPAIEDLFSDEDQQALLMDGNSTFTQTDDGRVVLSRVITFYQKSDLGADDEAWLDIMVPKTNSRVRYDWNLFKALNYGRHKLADDDSPAAIGSDSVVTPRLMHGAWAARCVLYERRGWIEDTKRTSREAVFERADDRNRLNERTPIRIIGNLIVDAQVLEFEA